MISDLASFHGRWDAKKLLLHQLSQTLPWESVIVMVIIIYFIFFPLSTACILFLIKINDMLGQEVLLSNMGMDAIGIILCRKNKANT